MATDKKDLLLRYYEDIFPSQDFFRWLNHSVTPSLDFANRELAYKIPSATDSSAEQMLRYQSYQTCDEFKRDLKRIVPMRMEVGPVYTLNPRNRKTVAAAAFHPISKELVFDIDLTDYDDLRTCCKGGNICIKCWQFITVAITVMERALRQDFGFEHILWVFSGGRGAHAWVCDAKARNLDDSQRRAITNYVALYERNMKLSSPLHPHIQASYDLLEPHFKEIVLVDQDPWRDPEADATKHLQKKLELVGILPKWESQSSLSKWNHICETAEKKKEAALKSGDTKKADTIDLMLKSIVLECLYPRLDSQVSKHLNHLLKSPFSIHPRTDRVCVPIDVPNHAQFDPTTVPTLEGLLLDEEGGVKTRVAPYMQLFNKFVMLLLRSEKRPHDSLDF